MTDPQPPRGHDATRAAKPIRVGLLVDGDTTPAWAYRMLEQIQSSSAADIVLVVQNAAVGSRRQSGWRRLVSLYKRLFFIIFSKVDARLSRVRDNPFSAQNLRPLLDEVHWMSVTPERRGFVDRFSDEAIAALGETPVDVFVRLGFGILKGKILELAPFGVWSYHHGDNRSNRGLPPAFWEVYHDEPVTGVTLQVLSEELDGGRALCRSFVKTNSIYVRQTQARLFWGSSKLLPRMLERLHKLGAAAFRDYVDEYNSDPLHYSGPLYTYPGNREALRILLRSLYRFARRKWVALLWKEQWRLRYLTSPAASPHNALWRFREIAPPADRFWADPFVIEREGSAHLYFEELVYATGKGTIAHLSIAPDGQMSKPAPVLEENHHLSYPFVFEVDGTLYMTPESAANRSVDLYRCELFPHRWTHVRTLLSDVDAADPTLVFHDGRWWLFVDQNEWAGRYGTDELYLYYSDSLLDGDWTPHPLNPVVSDVRCARPAGKLFVHDGQLFRPAQDGSRAYGGSVVIRRIDSLTTETYAESSVNRIDPDWDRNLVGTHTLNREGNTSVVDVLQRVSRIRQGRASARPRHDGSGPS